MSNDTNSSLMFNTNKLAESAVTNTRPPPVGAAAARKAEKKAQKKSTKIAISQEAKKEQMMLEQIHKEEAYINALRQRQAALIEERNKQRQAPPTTPPTAQRMDFKQHWQRWKSGWTSEVERLAIMKAGSYDDLLLILQQQARSECEKESITNIKPFYIGITNWIPGVITPARYHNDWRLEGQMRAGRINSFYFEYRTIMNQDTKTIATVSDPMLVKIGTILNTVGKDAWPYTLALSPVNIRTTYWQQDPIFKQIAQAFGDEISLYLDNLEKIQKEYTRQY